jgi:hypothetical protein
MTSQYFANSLEYAEVFNVDRQKLADLGFFEHVAKGMTEQSVAIFESASDAASLIFMHSVLDSAALDWSRKKGDLVGGEGGYVFRAGSAGLADRGAARESSTRWLWRTPRWRRR